MRNGETVNYNTHHGCGMTQEWLDNFNGDVKKEFRSYYNLEYRGKIDPRTFIIKLYKMLTTKYKFVITFEYATKNSSSSLYSICRPTVFIDGEFIVGLNYTSSKWSAIQQMLIHFCNHEYRKLVLDKNWKHTNKNVEDILKEEDIFNIC